MQELVLKPAQSQAKQDELDGQPVQGGTQDMQSCPGLPHLPSLLSSAKSSLSPSFGFFMCKMASVPLTSQIKYEDIL